MNIKKQVVRKAVTLSQMMRRRFLFTGASGIDSTTTAGGFPAGLATAFGAGGAALFAGGTATAELSSFKLLSTPEDLRPLLLNFRAHAPLTLQRRGIALKNIQFPATQGLPSL